MRCVGLQTLRDVPYPARWLKKLGPAVSAGFGMIIRVLFSVLYAALRVLLTLVVARGRGEAVKDVELLELRHGVSVWLERADVGGVTAMQE